MGYKYLIDGEAVDTMKEALQIYRALTDEGKATVVKAALDWMGPCNDVLADCMAYTYDGPCGMRWVEFVLGRMGEDSEDKDEDITSNDGILGILRTKKYRVHATLEVALDVEATDEEDVKELVEDHHIPIDTHRATINVTKIFKVLRIGGGE